MNEGRFKFSLRPIEKNDLYEVIQMLRKSKLELFPAFFKAEFVLNYKIQVIKYIFSLNNYAKKIYCLII